MQPSNETEAEALQRRQVEALERIADGVRVIAIKAARDVQEWKSVIPRLLNHGEGKDREEIWEKTKHVIRTLIDKKP